MPFFINSIIILILIVHNKTKIIVLPFKSNINKNTLQEIIDWDQFFSNEIYTEVSIGNPSQSLNIYINSDSYIFYISPTLCYENSPSFYNYSKSDSFHMITRGFEEDRFDELGEGFYASDTLSFYNSTDLQTNITKKVFEFFYSTYFSNKKINEACGIAGLGLKPRYTDYNCETLLQAMKKNSLIDNYSWAYIYFEKDTSQKNKILNLPKLNNEYIFNNFDGLIILGNYSYGYIHNDFDPNYLLSTLAIERDKNLKWDILFNKIYCNEDKSIIIEKDIHAYLSINYNYIISPKEYFDKIIFPFFDLYISNQICKIKEIKKSIYKYEIIFCDKNKFTLNDIKKFPTIYFHHHEFNYTLN